MNEQNREQVRIATTNAAAGIIAGLSDAEERAKLLTETRTVEGGRPYRVDANGVPQTMEGWMPQPTAVRSEVELFDAESFATYVNRFKNPGTIVFADERASRFTAVLDYHGSDGKPQWLRNRAYLQLVTTPEWDEWIKQDTTPMTQETFAQFLEDRIPDIAEPAGAKLVEMARNLEASISGSFRSAIRAQDGSINFQYVKDVQATTSANNDAKVALPTEVKLLLQPYESLKDRYEVTGKLRYRIQGGRLSLWFELFGVDEALDEAFTNIRAAVTTAVTDTMVLAGPAPKQQTAE